VSAVWFTSDLHLGHEKVAVEHRGFKTPEEHDSYILGEILHRLQPGDQLWILGDISSGTNRAENAALERLAALKEWYSLHLIPGNHESCHPSRTDALTHLGKFTAVFDSVQPFAKRRVPSDRTRRKWLSHFPWHGDGDRDPEGPERFTECRLHDNGRDWLLHGHLHSGPDEVWTAERSLHIGLDAWGLAPVRLDTVNDMIADRAKELTA
jgi:calcineurin-like phosphoesterase family protein